MSWIQFVLADFLITGLLVLDILPAFLSREETPRRPESPISSKDHPERAIESCPRIVRRQPMADHVESSGPDGAPGRAQAASASTASSNVSISERVLYIEMPTRITPPWSARPRTSMGRTA